MSHKCRAERRQWAWDEKVGNADDQAAAADAIGYQLKICSRTGERTVRIYVKRENWDGGLWMTLPATAADAQKLWQELDSLHPSVMLPFIGGADSRIKGMGESLAGELVFEKGHLVMLNRLARRTDGMGEEELLLFTAAVEMERPKSIEQVLETMGHLDLYELKPDIRDMEGLGRYAAKKEREEIPKALEGIFDYGLYGASLQHRYGCFTEGGFVERRQPEKEPQPENGGPTQRNRGLEPVFTVEVKKHPYGYEGFSLPMTERELAEAEARIGTAECGIEMRVLAVRDGLYETLPPGSSIGELNQAAGEVKALMDKGEPDWNLLLAALEAELPETMEDACRIIRNCADYEFLPLESLEPEDYARYILERDGIRVPTSLQPYIKYRQFGQRNMEEMHPVKTFYGVIVNRVRPIRPAPGEPQSFRLFSPLTITAYGGGPESIEPETLSGQAAVSIQEDIRRQIARSMEGYGGSGLAETLSSRILTRKVRSMKPDVEEHEGKLWGVLEVETVVGLTEREKSALTEEWRIMAGDGWGGQLLCMPVRTGGREVHIGFWDTENGSGLFIRPEEEFLESTGHFGMEMQ